MIIYLNKKINDKKNIKIFLLILNSNIINICLKINLLYKFTSFINFKALIFKKTKLRTEQVINLLSKLTIRKLARCYKIFSFIY